MQLRASLALLHPHLAPLLLLLPPLLMLLLLVEARRLLAACARGQGAVHDGCTVAAAAPDLALQRVHLHVWVEWPALSAV